MSERPQHPYKCLNKGCSNGYGSTFYSAPPEWFEAQKWFTGTFPSNCPDCKKWKDAQTDSMHRCKVCAQPIRRFKKAKAMHHKKEGVYKPPTECKRCTFDRENGKKAILEIEEFEEAEEEFDKPDEFLAMLKKAKFTSPSHWNFATDEKTYDAPQYRGAPDTRREHLEVHAQYTSPVKRTKSKTTKTDFGGSEGDFPSYLRGISLLVSETHFDCARELTQRHGRILKINVQTHDAVVLEVNDTGPPPVYRAVTTYKADVGDLQLIIDKASK